MKSPEPPWELLRAFLAVMRGGSLSAAARALDVAQPTVRRQVEALESCLGAVLFTRSKAGLAPTEAAVAAMAYVEVMASNAEALGRSISGSARSERGTVRVTCSEVLGVEALPAMLVSLRERHPHIDVELVATNRREDLLRREADVAVRMVRPTQAALLAARVGSLPIGLFARDTYLAAHPAPVRLRDLATQHALIGPDRDRSMLDALRAKGLEVDPGQLALRTDSDLAALAAVREGLGIGACQLAIARKTPALRRVLPSITFELEVWVVMHEDLAGVRRVRAVFDHLKGALKGYIARD
jgi:DNA-binding transcriptional LysR family regulator